MSDTHHVPITKYDAVYIVIVALLFLVGIYTAENKPGAIPVVLMMLILTLGLWYFARRKFHEGVK